MIKHKIKKHWKRILIYLFSAGFVGLGLLAFWISTFQMPDLQSFEARTISQSTKIYDRTGQVLLYDVHGTVRRTLVSLDKISPYLKEATIAIEDEGMGMPKEIMDKIFDPFFTTKDVGKGTGLGLSICHSIIEKHKGAISVQSEPNKGSTFTIKLPKLKT